MITEADNATNERIVHGVVINTDNAGWHNGVHETKQARWSKK
jgi:hypothetical protein